MADQSSRSPLRLLAPAALVVVGIIFLIIVASGIGGGGGSNSSSNAADTSTAEATKTATTKKPAKKQAPTYTIKAGDNLGSIAQKTRVPIEKLQELNPALDPQALVSGQKIKLR